MPTDDYTPTTEQVCRAYTTGMRQTFIASAGEHAAEFDRFLEARDARVRREAYDEGYERGVSDHCDADQPCDGPTAAESNPYRQENDR